jgi:hypothetical protein
MDARDGDGDALGDADGNGLVDGEGLADGGEPPGLP